MIIMNKENIIIDARSLKRPNVGECQKIFDRYGINDTLHNGTTSDLCAVIQKLEDDVNSCDDHLQSEAKYCAKRATSATSHASRNYWIGKQHGYENVIELLITKQNKEETTNE